MGRPFVQEFANYVLAEKSPEPLHKTEANCAQVHLLKGFKPLWVNRVPYGYVLLYPDWLAFFTDSTQPVGMVPEKFFSKEMVKPMLQTWKYGGRFQSVSSIAHATFQKLSTTERDRIKAFVANPNSLFIPLHTITSVRQTRAMGTIVMLEIRTNDGRDIRLAPNTSASLGPRFWKGMIASFGGTWEPKLQQALHEAVARNRGAA